MAVSTPNAVSIATLVRRDCPKNDHRTKDLQRPGSRHMPHVIPVATLRSTMIATEPLVYVQLKNGNFSLVA